MRMMKRKKREKRKRGRRAEYSVPYKLRHRFPRLRDHDHLDRELRDIEIMAFLKETYPPVSNSSLYGTNFLEKSLSELISSNTGRLRERSVTHGLSDEGKRRDLLTRLYLHFRSTFSLSTNRDNGDAIPPYGPGYEKACDPSCVWGQLWYSLKEKEKKRMKRFPRTPRFPRMIRFLRMIRFPRLAKKVSSEEADRIFNKYRCTDLMHPVPLR